MTATACPRLFEAEAMRDGRLTGARRAKFEQHVTGCPACSREIRALGALAESLRASPPDDADADELRVRRERTRLLAAFDGTLVAPERRWSARQRLLWPAALAVLVAGVVVLQRVRRPAVPLAHPSSAIVHADSTAVWSEHTEGDRESVVLERGALWIHVDHSSGEGRLVVVLPDGELEDMGTTFTVSAEDGHTTRVAVHEGHVVLRLRGLPSVTLGPGDAWIPDARPAASACASVAPPAEPAQRAMLAPAARGTSPASAPFASTLAPDPSVDFRAAMAGLDVGDCKQAAVAFASFLEKHPRDRHAEDAAYLRVIALQRCGDSGATKEAALEYLRRYPRGFRQAEVELLSR